MRKIDVLIAGALALAVVASAVGVVTYEDSRGLADFEVTFATRDVDLALPSDSGLGGSDVRIIFSVNLTNLTSVELTIRVSGGGARAQGGAVSVLVQPAGAAEVEADGTLPPGAASSVDIPVEVPLGDAPAAVTVRARDAAGALAQAAPARTNGTGTWNVTVSLPPGLPGLLNSPFTVTLTGRATRYDGEARLVLPEVSR